MGDTDLSFEALKRFEDIERRLDNLEGGPSEGPPETQDVSTDVPTETEETYELAEEEPTTGSRSRKRTS